MSFILFLFFIFLLHGFLHIDLMSVSSLRSHKYDDDDDNDDGYEKK